MKIGIVCYPTVGGSGVIATELGHELARRGHEVHFITYEIPFKLRLEKPNIFFHEVEISYYDLFKYPDYALTLAVKMAAVSKEHSLDILHVHYAIPHAASAFLAKQILGNVKTCVVTTLHGTDITLVGSEPSYYQIIKFSIEQSDGVTAVSNALKMQTCCQFGIQKPIEVIYNFFDPNKSFLERKPVRKLFVKDHQKLLVHASNYRPVKRPEDLVHIFSRMRKQLDAKLLCLGTGSGIDGMRKIVSEKGLAEDVIFLGKSRDVDAYVASSDLFLLPSSQESFGLAALEAMAYGVPVIATEVGGLPELVEEGKTGFLSPVGDVEKMSSNAIELLTNSVLYDSFSKASRQRAAQHFSADKIIPQYERYYKQVSEN